MATINGENVSVGDKVYDVTQGYGDVISTMYDNIQVHFKTGVRISFDSTGHYAGVRRLYWHNPVVIEPSKDNHLWQSLANIMSTVYNLLKKG